MDTAALPLVSIVTAFLNEERFLSEAIESVLEQDYQHWQLLLVDDGSTDKSTTIAKQYAERFAGKIVYCEHDGHLNKGLSASRNLGIQQGSGQYVAILDADDVWKSEKLSAQLAIFQEHSDVAMIAEASLYWHSWSDSATADICVPVGAPANRVYQPTELSFLLYPLGTGAAPCPSGLMIRREAWQAAGRFEESFRHDYQLYEDQAFLSKIYLKKKVYISGACNNLYRQRPGSIVQVVKHQGRYHYVRRHFLEWFSAYLKNEEFSNIQLNRIIAKALFPYHNSIIHRITDFLSKRIIKTLIRKVKPWW